MIEEFLIWATEKKAVLEKSGMLSTISTSLLSNNLSARIDIDTSVAAARITVWESGDFHLEIIDFHSSENIYQKNLHLDKFEDFERDVGVFIEILLRDSNK